MRILIVLFTLMVSGVYAQVTVRVVSLPANTPEPAALFIAGSFNGWNPGDSAYMLKRSGALYEIVLPAAEGTAHFKITRGSWGLCEGTTTGGRIENRSFVYSPGMVVPVNIEGWENSAGAASTAVESVHIINETFPVPQLGKTKRVWICLPEGYASDLSKRYPVLYMHDGQNVFDAATSFSGEWGVDETMKGLQQRGDKGCIVVGIDNGGASRLDEYSPFVNPVYGGGQGAAYTGFLVNTLKPYIDSAYRTKPGREHTGIAGSSMGGLISLYAAIAYPEVFSKAGIFSPAFWFTDSLYGFIAGHQKKLPAKFYFIAGKNESLSLGSDMDSMVVLLRSVGYTDKEIVSQIKDDGAHSEWFWRGEFAGCYNWLYNGVSTGIRNRDLRTWKSITVSPSRVKDMFSLSVDALSVDLVNRDGKPLFHWENVQAGTQLSAPGLRAGNYVLCIRTDKGVTDKKLMIE
jgi:predicted alpha/beta superfamily hydrolase